MITGPDQGLLQICKYFGFIFLNFDKVTWNHWPSVKLILKHVNGCIFNMIQSSIYALDTKETLGRFLM